MTRCLSDGPPFTLFRAAAAGDLGPGCYVYKTAAERSTERIRSMIIREAMVARATCQRSLISVVAADFRGAAPYVVLPYFEGVTLRRLLDRRATVADGAARLAVSMVLAIVRQVAEALAALHAAGWLHAQVRPEHVIVSPQGHATLLDLTQACRLETAECDAGAATPENALYAAPELFSNSQRITAAADFYVLGVVMYEALTGRGLFASASREQLARCHRSQITPDIRRDRTDTSLELAELLRRMLAKEPLRRPSGEELVRWLAELEIEELAL